MKLRISTRAKNFLKQYAAKNKLRNMQTGLEHFLVENKAIEPLPARAKAAPAVDLVALKKKNDFEAKRIRKLELEGQGKMLKVEYDQLEKDIDKNFKKESADREKELKAEKEVKNKQAAELKAASKERADKQKKENEKATKVIAAQAKIDKEVTEERAKYQEKEAKNLAAHRRPDKKENKATLAEERAATEGKK